MDPEQLTNLIAYHTELHRDAVASGNTTLAAYQSAMIAAFQMARGGPAPRYYSEESSQPEPDPEVAQLEKIEQMLAELKEDKSD